MINSLKTLFIGATFFCFAGNIFAIEKYYAAKVDDTKKYSSPLSPAWNNIDQGVDFVGNEKKWRTLSAKQTFFQAVYDSQKISFRFVAEKSPKEELNYIKKAKRDSGEIFSGEDIEFFLHLPDKTLLQFAINPEGAFFDSKNKNKEWNGEGISIHTLEEPGKWIAVLTIPFKDLNSTQPGKNSVWHFNVARTWSDTAKRPHLSSWHKLKNNGYHSPECFSEMVFSTPPKEKKKLVSQHPECWFDNSGLDEDKDNNQMPDAWSIREKNNVEYSEKAKLSHDYYIKLGGGASLIKNLNRQVENLQKLTLNIDSKGSPGSTHSVIAKFALKNGKETEKTLLKNALLTNSWKSTKYEIAIPENATVLKSIEIKKEKEKDGSASFDNIYLSAEDAGNSWALTPMAELPEIIGEPVELPEAFPWAAPANKKLKILFVIEGNSNFIIEKIIKDLSKQLDIESDIIQGAAARTPELIEEKLKKAAYDVVFYQGDFFSNAPEQLKEMIRKGVGLLAIASHNCPIEGNRIYKRGKTFKESPPLDFTPLNEMSPMKKGLMKFGINEIYAGKYGKGKFLNIICADRQFYRHGLLPAIDEIWLSEDGVDIEEELGFDWWNYYHSLYGKCLKWAAGTPALFSIEYKAKNKKYTPGDKVSLQLKNHSPSELSAKMSAALFRNEEYICKFPEIKANVKSGDKNEISWIIPEKCIAGRHFLNFKLFDSEGKVLKWGTIKLKLLSKEKVWIDKIISPDLRHSHSKGMLFIAKLSGKLQKGLFLKAHLEDPYKRLVWQERKNVPISGLNDKISFQVKPNPENLVTPYCKLTLSLMFEDREIDRKSKNVYWDLDKSDMLKDYVFSAYLWIPLHYRPAAFKLLRKIGFNTINCWPNGSFIAGQNGFAWMDGWSSIIKHRKKIIPSLQERYSKIIKPEDKHLRDGSLSDPEFTKLLQEAVNAYCSATQKNPPLGCFMCDEMNLAAPWNGEPLSEPSRDFFTMKAFREYLKEKYKSISALNEQWGTAYASFEDVLPLFTKEARAKNDNFSAWVEFRIFMDDVMTSAGKKFSDFVTNNNPAIRSGQPNFCWEGPFTGIDPSKLASSRTGALSYSMNEFNRSFKLPGTTIWNWSFYKYLSKAEMHGYIWTRLFHGSTGASAYGTWFKNINHPVGFLHPNIGMTKRALLLKEIMKDALNGAGRLIINTPRVTPQFVFLHSQPSMHISWLESKDPISFSWSIRKSPEADSYMNYFRSREAFEKLIQDNQWQYDYRTEKQITNGALKRCKALVLPMSVGIDKTTKDAILEWQKNGGIVIGDLRSGARDSLGKKADDNWTESVFGIERKSLPTYKLNELTIKNKTISFQAPKGGSLKLSPNTKCLANFKDGTPALIVNKNGKGLGVFFNFAATFNAPLKKILCDILISNGIKRNFTVCNKKNEAIGGYEIIRFQKENDPLMLIGAIRAQEADSSHENAFLQINKAERAYDIFANKNLGIVASIPLNLAPGDAKLFAISEYYPERLLISGNPETKAGKPIKITIKLEPEKTGFNVFHIEVKAPDGSILEAYKRNVDAVNGVWQGAIPVALNAHEGIYTVEAKDISSGITGNFHFELK